MSLVYDCFPPLPFNSPVLLCYSPLCFGLLWRTLSDVASSSYDSTSLPFSFLSFSLHTSLRHWHKHKRLAHSRRREKPQWTQIALNTRVFPAGNDTRETVTLVPLFLSFFLLLLFIYIYFFPLSSRRWFYSKNWPVSDANYGQSSTTWAKFSLKVSIKLHSRSGFSKNWWWWWWGMAGYIRTTVEAARFSLSRSCRKRTRVALHAHADLRLYFHPLLHSSSSYLLPTHHHHSSQNKSERAFFFFPLR